MSIEYRNEVIVQRKLIDPVRLLPEDSWVDIVLASTPEVALNKINELINFYNVNSHYESPLPGDYRIIRRKTVLVVEEEILD